MVKPTCYNLYLVLNLVNYLCMKINIHLQLFKIKICNNLYANYLFNRYVKICNIQNTTRDILNIKNNLTSGSTLSSLTGCLATRSTHSCIASVIWGITENYIN